MYHQVFEAGGLIQKVDTKPRVEQPPLLHDLGSLQQEANRRKGLTAEETLNLAQSLYESKLITYPRHLQQVYRQRCICHHTRTAQRIKKPSLAGQTCGISPNHPTQQKSVNGEKVTDHHALLTTTNRPAGLSANPAAGI